MLTENDKAWIRANREQLLEGRTVSVVLHGESQMGEDPYTHEPITESITLTTDVVWKEYSTVANGERSVIGGVELIAGDVKATFSDTIDLSSYDSVEYDGKYYAIVSVDAKGLGAVNRQETLVRRRT